jgi:hypothetical protein
MGITPRQESTGGKTRLPGISKAGEGYLRRLLVVGATSLLRSLQGKTSLLSRDSPVDQRIDASLLVQGVHRCVDYAVEGFGVGKCLVGQMVRLEIVPDTLDIVELRCVFGQPFDCQPVLARRECRQRDLTGMDRPIVLNQYDGLDRAPWCRAVETVKLLQMSDEVAAALRYRLV